jgi:signal transduction histidine kinase
MSPQLRRILLLLAVLAAGMVDVALVVHYRSGAQIAYELIRDVGVSCSFVAAGVVAGVRRPGNRTGVLMVLFGLAWSLHGLAVIPHPVAAASWFAVATVPDAILAHLIAVFPEGRATSRLQRLFLVANYATTLPVRLALLFVVRPRLLHCQDCPDVPGIQVGDQVGAVVVTGAGLIEVVLAASLACILVGRWRAAPEPRRRLLTPVFVVGASLLVLYLTQQALLALLSSLSGPVAGAFDLAILVLLLLWPLAFLTGLARLQLDRAAVGDLAVRLGTALAPGRLEQVLADVLHDPTLRLVHWCPDRQCFVDDAGRRVELHPDGGDRVTTVLGDGGAPLAALLHTAAALEENPRLVRAVAATAQLSIANDHLHAELRAQLEDVRASRTRIVEHGDAERHRIERNLHDGAQQRLVNLVLALGIARALIGTAPVEELRAALDAAAAELAGALTELRDLARGLHPLILSDAGLGPALESLAQRSALPVTVLGMAPQDRPPRRVEETAYYVAAETLANAAKHAGASAVTVSAARLGDQLVVEIIDDGWGGADPNGSGLRGLADRVAALDGQLVVDSPVGAGTRIRATLPCAS